MKDLIKISDLVGKFSDSNSNIHSEMAKRCRFITRHPLIYLMLMELAVRREIRKIDKELKK